MGAAARRVVWGEGVEAIFQDVEVECAEVSVGEFVKRVVGAVEFEVLVRGPDSCGELREAREDVLIERLEVPERDGVRGRGEVVEVAQQEAKRVAQLAVVVTDALHQVFAGRYVLAEVDRGDPEADNLAAEALGDIDRINPISQAL